MRKEQTKTNKSRKRDRQAGKTNEQVCSRCQPMLVEFSITSGALRTTSGRRENTWDDMLILTTLSPCETNPTRCHWPVQTELTCCSIEPPTDQAEVFFFIFLSSISVFRSEYIFSVFYTRTSPCVSALFLCTGEI